ncbi:unnamed protein product [Camellia sinensis]
MNEFPNTLKVAFSSSYRAMASLTSHLEHTVKPDALRSYLVEFISTFFFVFAAVGSAMSSRKMMPGAATDPSTLVVVAVSNAFALSVAVYAAANIYARPCDLRGHVWDGGWESY